MNEKELVHTIKSGGYWRVAITPGNYIENQYSHAAIKTLLKAGQISLRGWNYPHINHQNTFNRLGYTESYGEFGKHLEYLRFYRSGKFIHLFTMRENKCSHEYLAERYSWYSSGTPPDNLSGLSILSALYTLTEIFEFTNKIGQNGVPLQNGKVELELHGLENRMLYFDDFGRDLSGIYVCRDDCVKLSTSIPSEGICEQVGREVARNWMAEIVSHFQWDGVHDSFFRIEQNKFLKVDA